MVLQDARLFDSTIAENIAYGRPDATREEIVRAAKMAHVDHFVRTMPQGYETHIENDAESISQGQRQLSDHRARHSMRPEDLDPG